ncbi:MAG TPA: S8 family serine peptidase, partial [Rudaea sp.]|nr:S8 family serine peptidase [Rudaea sp.]
QYLPTSSLTSNNFATNEPIELNYTNPPSGQKQVQYVIARANVPATGPGATHVRYSLPGNGLSGYGPAEYFAYNTVTTGGHAMAEGSNGTAAYSVFRPSLPETFTSPGPVRIYFDDQGNRLPLPTVRRQPRVATADAANVSSNMNGYFAGDASSDYDSDGNFSGTSAAGPHAAAIAALVLEAHGGHHSLTPTQMTTLLEHSTFAHDLDPSYASGFARTSTGETITVTIASDGSGPSAAGSIGVTGTGGADANSITVKYTGSGNLNSITFNPQGDAADGGNVSGGSSGYQDSASQITYFENNSPGIVFAPVQLPLTVGSASTVLSGSVTPTFSNLAPAPSNGTTQYWTMGLGFDASFTTGNALRFTVGRAVQHSSAVGTLNAPINGTTSTSYLGDLLGGGVTLPRGSINLNGMSFSGTTAAGTFTGVIRNRLGSGYSPVDGYGFINAQQAVLQAAP